MIIFNFIVAIILGQLCLHLCRKLPPVVSEEITYKEFLADLKVDFKFDIKYTLILILFVLTCMFMELTPLKTLFYLLVTFVLLIVFSVDYRYQLIPDECQVALGMLGAIRILTDSTNVFDYCLGGLIGYLSFYGLGKLSEFIFRRQGMGYGDVKLMTGLGLIFGAKNTLIITLVSFVIGAVISLILMTFKLKSINSYIPFGPFIVIAAILLMFIPADAIIELYINFCAFLAGGISDLIYNIFYT